MPDLGPHASVHPRRLWRDLRSPSAALAAYIVADDRKQRRLLAELERRGIRRRSAKPAAAKRKQDAAEAPVMTEVTRAPSPLRRWGPALPLLIFAVLAGLFWYALQAGDPSLPALADDRQERCPSSPCRRSTA